MGKPISEETALVVILISLVFYSLMFSRDFAHIYSIMALAWLALYVFDKLIYDKRIKFPIEKSSAGRLESVFIALVAYAGFLVLTVLIMSMFAPDMLPNGATLGQQFKAVIQMMGTWMLQASTPILAQSKILMFLGWGILIPIVETTLFNLRIYEKVHDGLASRGINISKFGLNMVLAVGFVAGIATIMHLSAKGLVTSALIITLSFFSLSQALVIWRKHGREAVLFHNFANSIAVSSIFAAASAIP